MRCLLLLALLLVCVPDASQKPPGKALQSATPVAPKPEVRASSNSAPSIALVAEVDVALVKRLRSHVVELAETIGERNTERPEQYRQAASYLTKQMEEMGYEVTRQVYTSDNQEVANLIAVRRGSEEILVVGAHYDSIPVTPGADDNASGCAALLELARSLKDKPQGPTIRFVFFANEEPEHFYTESMGSLVYAKSCAEAGDKLVGMLSLETLGYYTDEPNSQEFPVGVTGYPTTGNFLAFVSNLSSRALMKKCLNSFLEAKTLPAEGIAAPDFLEGIGWSDHWSFWQHDYPALMVTDTALFRNPNYHAVTDTPDTLDYERLGAAVMGLEAVLLNF